MEPTYNTVFGTISKFNAFSNIISILRCICKCHISFFTQSVFLWYVGLFYGW